MMVISMAQYVYMLSMAFLVPLRRLKAKYVCLQTKEDKDDDRVTALDTPFVLYPNASCRCWVIEGSADIYPVTSNVFFFRSCYNGIDTVVREITVTPLIMELNLGKKCCNQYFYKTAAYHGYHFVANHCHKSCTLFSDGKHKDWFCYKSNGKYKCFAGIEDLPMFNSKNKDVQQYLTQKALDLCDMGFDAIRLDHATGPCYAFWKYFVRNVKTKFPNVRLIGEVWGELDFKPHYYIRHFLNKLRYDAQEARQLEYIGILDGVLDFRYQQFVCEAVHREKAIVNNRKLQEEVKLHFARYPTGFQLWLFLDNHDLNRFMFECDGDEKLFKEGINYSKQQKMPWLMFYGTEKEFTNKKSISDGTPYADERVRMCLK